jgi:hypothetical protein
LLNFLHRFSKTISNNLHKYSWTSRRFVSCWHIQNERTDRQKMLRVRFPKFNVKFQWNMNFIEWYSKSQQICLYKLFNVGGQSGTETDIMSRISHFRYAITNVLHIYRRPILFAPLFQSFCLQQLGFRSANCHEI